MGIVENTYAELKQQELKNNPYSCLHMADIDINPHQIEAFTFALSSLELGGVILADEVGLGKTIEAGLVIKYLLCSGKDKILLIMPSNLRKQWQVELEEKFDIDSLIVDSSNWEDYLEEVKSKQAVIIVSYHFASKRKAEFGKIAWDFCVFDEAHRLRNVYKNGSKMANSLYELTKGIPKILLTATPMQNTLLDIYGLVQFIDDRVFYSKQIFSERYLRGEDYKRLKKNCEYILVYAKDYSLLPLFNGPYIYTEISELVNQYQNEGKSWKYTTVLVNPGDKEYLGSTVDGDGNEIKVYLRKNPEMMSIKQIAQRDGITVDDAYSKYGIDIFQTTNAQSSIRTRIMDYRSEMGIEEDLISIEYVPKTGKNRGKVYEQFYKGDKCRLFVWLRDTSEVIDGKLFKKDLQGTYWDMNA